MPSKIKTYLPGELKIRSDRTGVLKCSDLEKYINKLLRNNVRGSVDDKANNNTIEYPIT